MIKADFNILLRSAILLSTINKIQKNDTIIEISI